MAVTAGDVPARSDPPGCPAGTARPASAAGGRERGVVGLGATGAGVVDRLRAFGPTITTVRAHPEWGGVAGVERVVGPGDLAVAVADSDVVICCAMLHAGSRQLFDAGVCAAFEAGAVFVNVARGGLVDEDALLDALDRHHVAGAFLDVFATEPADPSSPLVTHPQVMATPHVAGVTGRMFDRSSRLFADNVRRWAGGAPPEWPVNRPDTPRGIRR